MIKFQQCTNICTLTRSRTKWNSTKARKIDCCCLIFCSNPKNAKVNTANEKCKEMYIYSNKKKTFSRAQLRFTLNFGMYLNEKQKNNKKDRQSTSNFGASQIQNTKTFRNSKLVNIVQECCNIPSPDFFSSFCFSRQSLFFAVFAIGRTPSISHRNIIV